MAATTDANGRSDAPWRRWEVGAYGVILILALALRLWDLGGQALHHDESLHAVYSWYLYDGRGYLHNPLMHGPFQFFGTAAIFWVLWDSDFTARLLPAIFGVVLVGTPILLRPYLGRSGALVTSVLLTLSPSFLYFSRFARNDIYMAVWVMLSIAFIWRYLDSGKSRYLVGLAAALALSFSTKESTFHSGGRSGQLPADTRRPRRFSLADRAQVSEELFQIRRPGGLDRHPDSATDWGRHSHLPEHARAHPGQSRQQRRSSRHTHRKRAVRSLCGSSGTVNNIALNWPAMER